MRFLLREIFALWRATGLRGFPIGTEILNYRLEYLIPDLVAALNVSLLVFPQAIVYALLAGLPVEYGLYGAIVATLLSSIFSGSRVLNLGPTNSTAVLMLSAFTACGFQPDQFTVFLPIVLVLTGTFLIVGSMLNVASLVRYVSKSVIFGYVSAVIIIMIINQIHCVLGFELNIVSDRVVTFFDVFKATIFGLKDIRWISVAMALCTWGLYTLWRNVAPRSPYVALTIFTVSALSYSLVNFFHCDIPVLERICIYNWKASLSGFNLDNLSSMTSVALALSFICLLDGTTILKTLSVHMKDKIDINQMVFGMGWANIGCGLCSGMPASGSLVRSSANYFSGAKTSLTSFYCGIFCMLGVALLGPFFNYIPKAGLATILILFGLDLFDKKSIRVILNSNKMDIYVFYTTAVTSFFIPLHLSVFLGVFLSIILFLKKASMLEFYEYISEGDGFWQNKLGEYPTEKPELSVVHVEGNLFFGSSEIFQEQIKMVCRRPQLKVIILKLRNAYHIDATCLLALKDLIAYTRRLNRYLILCEVKKPLYESLKRSGVLNELDRRCLFFDNLRHLNASMKKALEFAEEIVGDQIAVHILKRKKTNDQDE